MDELTLFADLRPDERLGEADLAEIRRELFPNAGAGPALQDLSPQHDRPAPRATRSRPTNRQRRSIPYVPVAAAVLAATGVVGLWAIVRRTDAETPPATVPSIASTVAPPAQPAVRYDVPLIGFAEPGWTVTGASDTETPWLRLVVLLSDAKFDGPWVEVRTTPDGPGPSATSVDIDGAPADVVEIESGVILRWRDASGTNMEAFGWRTALDTVVAVAEAAFLDDSGIGASSLPAGATIASEDATRELGHFVEYRFSHEDGREVGVTFTAGGTRGLRQQQGDSAALAAPGVREVMVGDELATIVDYAIGSADPPDGPVSTAGAETSAPSGSYRLHVLRGFWAWTFTTEGFDSAEQLVDLVAGSGTVGVDQWTASLSESIVTPADQGSTVRALLEGVPLPPGFDSDALGVTGTLDRNQFIAHVSGSVACAWIDEWQAGRAAGDTERSELAASQLSTSRDWAMLIEIEPHGGWAESVWSTADALEGVDSPLDVTADNAAMFLNCTDAS